MVSNVCWALFREFDDNDLDTGVKLWIAAQLYACQTLAKTVLFHFASIVSSNTQTSTVMVMSHNMI